MTPDNTPWERLHALYTEVVSERDALLQEKAEREAKRQRTARRDVVQPPGTEDGSPSGDAGAWTTFLYDAVFQGRYYAIEKLAPSNGATYVFFSKGTMQPYFVHGARAPQEGARDGILSIVGFREGGGGRGGRSRRVGDAERAVGGDRGGLRRTGGTHAALRRWRADGCVGYGYGTVQGSASAQARRHAVADVVAIAPGAVCEDTGSAIL
jgi:hypothetical protein